jgi:hypothetical protein
MDGEEEFDFTMNISHSLWKWLNNTCSCEKDSLILEIVFSVEATRSELLFYEFVQKVSFSFGEEDLRTILV